MLNKKEVLLSNNLKISYLDNELKNKDVLFFAHGWGADKDNMRAIFNYLDGLYRIISIDLPGFGESFIPPEEWGSPEYSLLLKEFFSKLKLTSINYVGHSFGGKLGIILSSEKFTIIKKMVLISSAGIRNKHNALWYFKVYTYKLMKYFYLKILKNESKLEKLKERRGSSDYKAAGGLRNNMVKVVNEDFTNLLSNIEIPVFLYWGEKDKDTPLWMAKKMEKLIPDAGLFVVKNGGHFPFIEDPRIIEIIKNFIG